MRRAKYAKASQPSKSIKGPKTHGRTWTVESAVIHLARYAKNRVTIEGNIIYTNNQLIGNKIWGVIDYLTSYCSTKVGNETLNYVQINDPSKVKKNR